MKHQLFAMGNYSGGVFSFGFYDTADEAMEAGKSLGPMFCYPYTRLVNVLTEGAK